MSQCSDIRGLTDPMEICELAKQNCGIDSIIPYARIVFCLIQSQSIRIGFLSATTLIVSGAMGIAAFDYLSANLTYIAEISALPQSLMGVTILAFGNGSVDVFGAFVAFASDEGGMAVGEIMGGAFFVITVVVGSMAIISPFKVNKAVPKDIMVLQLAILYTFLIIRDGIITIYESLFGIIAYIVYSLWVVLSQINDKETYDSNLPPSEVSDELLASLPSPHNPDEGHLVDNTMYTPIRPSLYNAVDLNWKVHQRLAELDNSEIVIPRAPIRCHAIVDPPQQQFSATEDSSQPTCNMTPPSSSESIVPQETANENAQSKPAQSYEPAHARRRSSAPEISTIKVSNGTDSVYDPILQTPQNPQIKRSHLDLPKLRISGTKSNSANNSPAPSGSPMNTDFLVPPEPHQPIYSRSFQRQRRDLPYSMKELVARLLNAHEMDVRSESPEPFNLERIQPLQFLESAELPSETDPKKYGLLSIICPPLSRWGEKTWIHRLVLIPMIPILSLLSWTVPLSTNAGSLLYICIHCVAVPLIIPMMIPSLNYTLRVIFIEFVTVFAGLLWWLFLRKPLPSQISVAAVGFIMGILWVVLLATELVSVLTLLGEVCQVSNTILGLTVFALGDSLGDFVSNITIAQIGYPTMAVAACYGGPIFTLLIGVFGSSLMTMAIRGVSTVSVSAHGTLNVSAIAIMLTLTALQIQLMRNNYQIGKKIGLELIIIYAVYILSSVLFSRT